MSREQHFLQIAIELSREGMEKGEGGPFGCIVVKGDEIIGRGWNRVLSSSDPTAHAEMLAIRQACQHLQSGQLQGCEVYTSCEPCPMCLGAIYWARPDRVYYANTHLQAAAIGFDDTLIYQELQVPHAQKKIPLYHMPREEAQLVFRLWDENEGKTMY